MARTALCLALAAMSAVCGLAEDVLTLTGDSFADAVKNNDKLIVEFYAPWCGHCKKLEPEFEKAAAKLKADGIALAKVDATEEGNKALAERFKVQGFPTLKIFRGAEDAPGEYEGPRDAEGIVSYAKKQFGPAVAPILTEDEAKTAAAPRDDIHVIGVFPGGADAPGAKAFAEAAEVLRNDASFFVATEAGLVKDAAGAEAVLLYRDFDEPLVKYDGPLEKTDIAKFVEKNSSPRLTSLDRKPRNKKALAKAFADKKPKVLGVMPAGADGLKDFQEELIKLSNMDDDKVHVLYLDPAENAGAMNFFGAKVEDAPLLLIHDPASDAKYLSGKLAIDKVAGYVADFKAGKLERTIKSEDPPADNSGPVKVVTAKTFQDIVFSGKNVLVEFYAPWCGHCKKLEPVWNELGEAAKDMATVTIAKMDATANDVPDSRIAVKGFPTIKFVTKEGEVKDYSGGRALDDFKKLLEKEAAVSFAGEEELEVEKPPADDKKEAPKDEL